MLNSIPSSPLVSCENFFVPGGYHIGTKGTRPWCHTLSNPVFGTLLSDMSLGFTWALNSRQNKLTPWSNDICSDFYGEKILLKLNGKCFDAVSGADAVFYDTMGIYTCKCDSVSLRITVQVDKVAMKKRILIKLEGAASSKAELIYAITPQLGESKSLSRFVKEIPCEQKNCVVLQNPMNTDYGGYMGITASLPFSHSKEKGTHYLKVTPQIGSEVCFYTVFGSTLKSTVKLMSLPFKPPVDKAVSFSRFSREVNTFASALLLHNVRDTRIFARCGFYQCSGAYGFRDQLQDAAALIHYEPFRCKIQILRSCAVQFAQGDVLHWYHTVPTKKPCFKGVRTHCSDDLLWLPLTIAEYVSQTGDRDILSLPVAFLQGEELKRGERESYGEYYPSKTKASVYEHCMRAIKHSLTTGEHSLPLIKSGDWNDSFSAVGSRFKGESVWLGEFLRLVCLKLLPICESSGSSADCELLRDIAQKMKGAVEEHGYNGKYFLRGYYDNGSPLGDENANACKIDLLPQAFAVFADIGTKQMQLSALSHAYRELFDGESLTLKLFTPPFTETSPRAGYVNDYPPGCRENGGQYTHGAIWFALALNRMGLTKEAKTLCNILCPALPSDCASQGENSPPAAFKSSRKPISKYRTEPYAMSGDIYTLGRLKGIGGWSLYTGSAGWYLRLLTELSEA